MIRALAYVFALLLGSLVTLPASAYELLRSESDEVERGNEHLGKGQAKEALEAYDDAVSELPNDPGVQLNRGLALLALDKLGEAREALHRAAGGTAPREIRGPALYNLGLTFLKEAEAASAADDLPGAKKQLQEAVESFKGSLRAQPNNPDAAWNLELARRRLSETEQKEEQKKKEQEEQKKQDPQQQDPQKKPEDESKDKDPNQPKSDEPKQQDGSGEQDEQDPKEPEAGDAGAPQPKPQPEQADAGAQEPEPQEAPSEGDSQGEASEQPALPEHMEQALDALEAGEENLEKMRARQRARGRQRRIEKDW